MRTASKRTQRVVTRTILTAAIVIAANVLRGGTVAAQGTATAQSTASQAVTVSSTQDKVEDDKTALDPGRQLYARHCAACHGEQGNGRGAAAAYLFPRPRDIRAGRFRLVSTSNNVPTPEDLHAVLLRGMPGSSMPPWGHLSQQERDAIVGEVMRLRKEGAREYYIKVLKEQDELTDEEIAEDDTQTEIQEYVDESSTPGESSALPEVGEPTPEVLNDAKQVYATAGCQQCHGREGKGDGVQKMIDEEQLPTAPRDFTVGIFKGNPDPASMYRRIAYGMPGTPMPGSRQLTPQQMMGLAHYVRSMSTEKQRQAAVLNRGTLTVKAVKTLTADANDAAWSTIPSQSFRMTPLWWRNNADPDLQVQAIHDRKTIAVRLSWRDDEGDRQAVSGSSFEDAVAMELYRGDSEPFIGMGGPGSPIDVWFWDADRQGKPRTIEDIYPNTVVDVYPFTEKVAASAEYSRPLARTAAQAEVSLPAKASGNQIVPPGGESGATNLSGSGPGSSTFRMPRNQSVSGIGTWHDGRWTVVMTRTLALDSAEKGVPLESGCHASVAFAVWDGSQKDRDGKKLITIWQNLVLED